MPKLILIKKKRKSGQEIQDEFFKKMPAEKKIKLASEFFDFAKLLNRQNGTRKTVAKISNHS